MQFIYCWSSSSDFYGGKKVKTTFIHSCARTSMCVLIRVGWCVRVILTHNILTHNILTLVSTNIKYYSPLKIYI